MTVNISFYESILLAIFGLTGYFCILTVKRLFFHPLSHFPGPKLAAATFWYEFYYDCILQGQYSTKIKELHREFNSDVIRISPNEIHISDADFFQELFSGPGRKRDNDPWFVAQFGANESHFSTISHDLHRERRAALAPLFSIGSVRKLQPVIEERVDELFERFREFRDNGEVFNLVHAFSALTNDVICEFSFAKSEHLIETPDFGAKTTDMILSGTATGHWMKHLPAVLKLIEAVPESIILKILPVYGAFTSLKHQLAEQIRHIQQQKANSTWASTHPTVFSEILESKLPPHEKSATRLGDDGRILVQAGTLTTAWTLALCLYYLLAQPQTLEKLRQEIAIAIPDPNISVNLVKLEQLPYLSAVIKEALRMSFGTSSRLPRIPAEESLTLADKKNGKVWHIPMKTKCSMTPEHILSNPAYFKSPMSFIPERWLEDKNKSLDKYFVPFAKGTRACLGMNLAYGELYLVLGKLLRTFGGPESKGEDLQGVFRLFETTARDVEMASDGFVVLPWAGSKGVRVKVEKA